MERIMSLNAAEAQVFQKVKLLCSDSSKVLSEELPNLEKGIELLNRLRKRIYEDLNQIQHEAMILRAARSLERNGLVGKEVEWFWNPRQTGTAEEPDLRGKVASQVAISAEITTSDRPIGTIDQRMRKTLEKLSKMPGRKIYFVGTAAMQKRAKTKVRTAGYQIEVRLV